MSTYRTTFIAPGLDSHEVAVSRNLIEAEDVARLDITDPVGTQSVYLTKAQAYDLGHAILNAANGGAR